MNNFKVWTVIAKADRKKLTHASGLTEEINHIQKIDLKSFLLPAVRLLSEMHYKKLKG